jgi:hypothetical protein
VGQRASVVHSGGNPLPRVHNLGIETRSALVKRSSNPSANVVQGHGTRARVSDAVAGPVGVAAGLTGSLGMIAILTHAATVPDVLWIMSLDVLARLLAKSPVQPSSMDAEEADESATEAEAVKDVESDSDTEADTDTEDGDGAEQ